MRRIYNKGVGEEKGTKNVFKHYHKKEVSCLPYNAHFSKQRMNINVFNIQESILNLPTNYIIMKIIRFDMKLNINFLLSIIYLLLHKIIL